MLQVRRGANVRYRLTNPFRSGRNLPVMDMGISQRHSHPTVAEKPSNRRQRNTIHHSMAGHATVCRKSWSRTSSIPARFLTKYQRVMYPDDRGRDLSFGDGNT